MSYNPNVASESLANSQLTAVDTKASDLKRHRELVKEIKGKYLSGENNTQVNPDKVARQANVVKTEQSNVRNIMKLKFNWEKTNDNDSFNIIPTEKSIEFSSLHETNSTSEKLLSIFGFKIDISNQLSSYKNKFQKFFIESKSHNPLVGKFSELKYGMTMALLSALGVEPNTIEELKKEALKKAIDDNINCFKQNEYNLELLTVFSTSMKDKGRVKVLTELRSQLIKQMKNYGETNFYTKERIYLIKKGEVTKILNDILEEKQNLEYIRNFQ